MTLMLNNTDALELTFLAHWWDVTVGTGVDFPSNTNDLRTTSPFSTRDEYDAVTARVEKQYVRTKHLFDDRAEPRPRVEKGLDADMGRASAIVVEGRGNASKRGNRNRILIFGHDETSVNLQSEGICNCHVDDASVCTNHVVVIRLFQDAPIQELAKTE